MGPGGEGGAERGRELGGCRAMTGSSSNGERSLAGGGSATASETAIQGRGTKGAEGFVEAGYGEGWGMGGVQSNDGELFKRRTFPGRMGLRGGVRDSNTRWGDGEGGAERGGTVEGGGVEVGGWGERVREREMRRGVRNAGCGLRCGNGVRRGMWKEMRRGVWQEMREGCGRRVRRGVWKWGGERGMRKGVRKAKRGGERGDGDWWGRGVRRVGGGGTLKAVCLSVG